MKKILIAIAVLVVAAFGVVGYASAQSQNPPQAENAYGPGMMNGFAANQQNGFRHSSGTLGYEMMGPRMAGVDGDEGPLHDSMVDALAETLGLTPTEIETRHDAGETMWDIATSQGLSIEAIQKLMTSAHDTALENAVANGALTAEQASWMNNRMEQMWTADGEPCVGGNGAFSRAGGFNR